MRRRMTMGLHECAKLARSGRIRLLFLAADLERVPGERGLDALVGATLAHCASHAAPVVFLPSRYSLGASASPRLVFSSVLFSFLPFFSFTRVVDSDTCTFAFTLRLH